MTDRTLYDTPPPHATALSVRQVAAMLVLEAGWLAARAVAIGFEVVPVAVEEARWFAAGAVERLRRRMEDARWIA